MPQSRNRFARILAGTLLATGLAAVAAAQVAALPSPFQVVGTLPEAGATRLAVNAFELEALRQVDRVILTGFSLDATEVVDLELRRVDPFTSDATLVVVGPGGESVLPRPEGIILSGHVMGHPESIAVLGIHGEMINGLVELNGRTRLVANQNGMAEPIIYDIASIPADMIDVDALGCSSSLLTAPRPNPVPGGGGGSSMTPRGGPPCRHATIAIDTDYELLQDRFGGNQANCTAYISLLVAATSEIYNRDVNTSLSISYLRLWTTPADPWDQSGSVNQLYQFRDYWNANMTSVDRSVAHMLSARGLGGGVAWLSVLCYPEYDYAVDGNLNGSFPYPVQHNNGSNWDLMVFAHELGHNFGAPHTHQMSPVIDNCAGGDCSVVPNGTIMSYCHLCSGGLANVRMEFHTRTISEAILPYLADETGCELEISAPQLSGLTPGRAVCLGSSINLSVTASGGGVFTYQWQRNNVNIPGATSATHLISPFGAGSAATYRVIVTNSCNSTTSGGIVLTACTNQFDLNGDCETNLTDLSILLAHFGGQGGFADGDLNLNGTVDLSDLSILLAHFGQSGC